MTTPASSPLQALARIRPDVRAINPFVLAPNELDTAE